MSAFEFVFPLFALLVGLSTAEMLTGLANALKSKHDIHVGWLTPLLGTLILINLAMFWQGSWEMRDAITADSSTLLLVLVVDLALGDQLVERTDLESALRPAAAQDHR